MKYWANCTTCDAKHKRTEGTTECRFCRGWYHCSSCSKRMHNSQFAVYRKLGRQLFHTVCRECAAAKKRANYIRDGVISTASRPHPRAKFTTEAEVLESYGLTSEHTIVKACLASMLAYQPYVAKQGRKPRVASTVDEILTEAGYDWLEIIRISQAVLELYRLEIQQEKAA